MRWLFACVVVTLPSFLPSSPWYQMSGVWAHNTSMTDYFSITLPCLVYLLISLEKARLVATARLHQSFPLSTHVYLDRQFLLWKCQAWSYSMVALIFSLPMHVSGQAVFPFKSQACGHSAAALAPGNGVRHVCGCASIPGQEPAWERRRGVCRIRVV